MYLNPDTAAHFQFMGAFSLCHILFVCFILCVFVFCRSSKWWHLKLYGITILCILCFYLDICIFWHERDSLGFPNWKKGWWCKDCLETSYSLAVLITHTGFSSSALQGCSGIMVCDAVLAKSGCSIVEDESKLRWSGSAYVLSASRGLKQLFLWFIESYKDTFKHWMRGWLTSVSF